MHRLGPKEEDAQDEGPGDHHGAGREGPGPQGKGRVAAVNALHDLVHSWNPANDAHNALGVGGLLGDHHATDDGGHDAPCRQEERESDAPEPQGPVALREGEGEADGHGRKDRIDVGLEEIRTHAGDVTHIVAYVVRDDRRVAGVVLGNSGLDLTHQVGAHVRGLGVDAAAHAGEERDAAGAHAEGRQRLDAEEGVRDGKAHEPQPHDDHAHDAASGERRLEGGTRVLRRCEGRTPVRVGRDVHPDIPGCSAAERTQHEGEGRPEPEHPPQQQGDDADEGRQPGVLLLEERHGPPVNDRRELDDTVVLDLSLTELLKHHPRIAACYDAKNKGNEHKNQPHSARPPHNHIKGR